MSLSYLSGADPGLVRQGSDRKVTDSKSGRVELIREYGCRTTYVPIARTQLIPGSKPDDYPDLTLEDFPEEREEIGWVFFACRYVGIDSSVVAKVPPRLKVTNFVVLTAHEGGISYSIRVGYPTFAYQLSYPRGNPTLPAEPQFDRDDFILQLVVPNTGVLGVGESWIMAVLQQTENEEKEFVDIVERKISYSWVPFAQANTGIIPAAAQYIRKNKYQEIWGDPRYIQ